MNVYELRDLLILEEERLKKLQQEEKDLLSEEGDFIRNNKVPGNARMAWERIEPRLRCNRLEQAECKARRQRLEYELNNMCKFWVMCEITLDDLDGIISIEEDAGCREFTDSCQALRKQITDCVRRGDYTDGKVFIARPHNGILLDTNGVVSFKSVKEV